MFKLKSKLTEENASLILKDSVSSLQHFMLQLFFSSKQGFALNSPELIILPAQ
jgi:hypothetical protein